MHPMIRENDLSDLRGGDVSIPVDLGLLEETAPQAERAMQYDVPDPQAVAELAAAQEHEQKVADEIVTVRDEQSLHIANLATDNVSHFLIHQAGQELCGGCGEPFPCSKWVDEIGPRNLAQSSGQPVPDEDKARAVATLLGVSMDEARQIVLVSTPLDQVGDQRV